MKLHIYAGGFFYRQGDLGLLKLDKDDYYAVVHDPHQMFRRPSARGDELWEDFGFRCIRRKEQAGHKHVVSIDSKNMLVLQLVFEDVEIHEDRGIEVQNVKTMNIVSAGGGGKSVFFPWWTAPGSFKTVKFIDQMVPLYNWVRLKSEDEAAPIEFVPHRVRDWLPENSVYPKKFTKMA